MLDLSFLEQFTKGNTSKMKRYISLYLKVAPEIFESMSKNLKDENWTELAINAHSLKPQADYIGIESLKSLLIEIENCVKMGQHNRLMNLYQEAYDLHKKSELFLNDKLKQL